MPATIADAGTTDAETTDAETSRSGPGDAAAATAEHEQRRGLRKMKTVATALLVGAAVIFVVAKLNEDRGTWVGYVRAVSEAAMVGALADWFAVTALFRHPLRLPIPHTAIIPRRKDQIGASLGDFVESNFLTAEVIRERLRGAEVARRVGDWLADEDHAREASASAADVLRGTLDVLDDDEIQSALDGFVSRRVDDVAAAPLVGRVVEVTVDGDHHQRLLDAVLVGLDRFIVDNEASFRRRLYDESPWWVPEPIDDRVFDKIVDVVGRFLGDVRANPHHELRRAVDERAGDLATRLREDPALRQRGEELKAELLAHPEMRRWIDSLWTDTKTALVDAAADPNSELRERLASGLQRFGETLRSDPALQNKVDAWVLQAVGYLVERYRSEVSDIIASTVARWDAESTAERIELQVGRDLQFIRINGTIVGGLAGLAIHAISQLL